MSTATLDAPATQTPVPKANVVHQPTEWSWLYDVVDQIGPGQRLSVSGADWGVYQKVMDRRDGNRKGMKIQYDCGEIHLMPTYFLHELLKKLLAQLIEAYVEERNIEVVPAGGMTVSREDKDRGFEPDECYYVQNCRSVLKRENLDFTKDPPPDLTIEIEITSPVSKRLPIFAAFRVPEVWRYNGTTLSVLHLMPDGRYEPMTDSLAIPGFPFVEIPRYLTRAGMVDNTSLVREFRQWVRTNLAPKS